MSDIHKCGCCDLLVGYLRRLLCSGNRRGSSESCYRELGDQDTLRFDGGSEASRSSTPSLHDLHDPNYSEWDLESPSRNNAFVNELYTILIEDAKRGEQRNWDKRLPPRMFHSFRKKRRRRALTSSIRDEEVVLDNCYPMQVQLLLSRSAIWSFNSYDLHRATGGRCLPILCMHLFSCYGLIEFFKLLPESCWKLFRSIEDCYHATNPYHNSVHAADVTQAMHCFLQEPTLSKNLSQLEVMVVLLAAITHDLDHPGVNHSFLVATNHPLAIIFNNHDPATNDMSPLPRRTSKGRNLRDMLLTLRSTNEAFSRLRAVSLSTRSSSIYSRSSWESTSPCESLLEHHHWRAAYSVILESGIFDHMKDRLPEIQRMLKSLILATDITRQNEYLTVFKDHLQHKTLDMERPDHRHMVLQMALKTADISNPGRPWSISRKWSLRVCDEFYQQGDKELKLKLKVSNLCDREKDTIPKIQTGFFRFVVTPLFTEWHHYLKSDLSRTMLKNLVHNEAEWTREGRRSSQASKSTTHSDLQKTNEVESESERKTKKGKVSLNAEELTSLLLEKSVGRRSSHSPVKKSKLKDMIRRYSAPVQLDPSLGATKPSMLEVTLMMGKQKRRAAAAAAAANAAVAAAVAVAAAGPSHSPDPEPLIDLSSPRRLLVGYTVQLDSDDDDDYNQLGLEEKGVRGIGSVIVEESSVSSGSQPTTTGLSDSARLGLLSEGITGASDSDTHCLDSPRLSVGQKTASNCELSLVDELSACARAVVRRRGSEPAPTARADLARLACSLSHQLRPKHSASCHQWVSGDTPPPAARRGSLPLEVSPRKVEI